MGSCSGGYETLCSSVSSCSGIGGYNNPPECTEDCSNDLDSNGNAYPGASEICDGIDNDCNANTSDGLDVIDGICETCSGGSIIDNDSDNDSICNANDPCPLDTENDEDGDGVCRVMRFWVVQMNLLVIIILL